MTKGNKLTLANFQNSNLSENYREIVLCTMEAFMKQLDQVIKSLVN